MRFTSVLDVRWQGHGRRACQLGRRNGQGVSCPSPTALPGRSVLEFRGLQRGADAAIRPEAGAISAAEPFHAP